MLLADEPPSDLSRNCPRVGCLVREHCRTRTVGLSLQRGCHVSSEPIRQPANDLIAFDISKQSPEQIANLFARWKEQRTRLQAPEPQRRPPHLMPVPPIAHGAVVEEAEEAASATIADSEPGGALRYTASFEALLSAREPTLAQRVWNPDAGLAKLGRPHPPRRRSRTRWLLAGAASVVAVTAMAGGALWERSAGQPGWTQAGDKPAAGSASIASPAEAAASATYPMDIPMAEPFVAKATASRQADWPMRQAVDLALMKTAPVAETAHLPLMPQLKPPVPVVRTASKPAAKPAAAQPDPEPSEAPVARVELPLVPSVTTATVSVPVAPATEARNDDSRSNVITGRGNDKDNFTFGANGRVASSSSRPTGASGSGGAHGSGSAGGSTGGSGDPGSSGGTGGNPGGGTGGSDPGGGAAGGGDAGGGDAGGGDPGGGSGGGDSGGGDSGGGDSGGDASSGGEGGESGESDGSDDGGGIGGAIGGAIGGLGDAIGGALGGGQGDANKDKDEGKDKDKSD
jgi:hypothetical protein